MFGYLITALIGCGVMFLSSGAYAQEASTTYDSIAPWRVDKPVYIQETGPLRPRLLREMHVEGPQGQVTVPSPLELFYRERIAVNLEQYGYHAFAQLHSGGKQASRGKDAAMAEQAIDVLIAGHVLRPGRKTLTAQHNVLNALIEAGGVTKTGSLRQIRLVRNGQSTAIDLYPFLLKGWKNSSNLDLRLINGDRIIVPPIGSTIAVTGDVGRPAIYETLPKSDHDKNGQSGRLSLNDMLELGGGSLSPGNNLFVKIDAAGKKREIAQNISTLFRPAFEPSSALVVSRKEADSIKNLVDATQGHTEATAQNKEAAHNHDMKADAEAEAKTEAEAEIDTAHSLMLDQFFDFGQKRGEQRLRAQNRLLRQAITGALNEVAPLQESSQP